MCCNNYKQFKNLNFLCNCLLTLPRFSNFYISHFAFSFANKKDLWCLKKIFNRKLRRRVARIDTSLSSRYFLIKKKKKKEKIYKCISLQREKVLKWWKRLQVAAEIFNVDRANFSSRAHPACKHIIQNRVTIIQIVSRLHALA